MREIINKMTKIMLSMSIILTTLMTNNVISGLGVSNVNAAENETYSVSEYTPIYNGDVTMEYNGDKFYQFNTFPSASEFTFSADILIEESSNISNKQSAGLIFGIKNKSTSDSNAIKVNVNGSDSPIYGRAWGYATPSYNSGGLCALRDVEGVERSIDFYEKFRMVLNVTKNDNGYKLVYTVYNTDENGNPIAETIATSEGYLDEDYAGGTFGLIVYRTKATFSNITLETGGETYVYGNTVMGEEKDVVTSINNSDTYMVMSDPYVTARDFTYESDVTILEGTSAALAFSIKDPTNPKAGWMGANFDFASRNDARIFNSRAGVSVSGGDTNNISDTLDKSLPIHMKLQVISTGETTANAILTLNNVGQENYVTVEATLTGYTGGYLGRVAWNSSAKFENTTIKLGNNFEVFNSTDFTNVGSATMSKDKVNDTITIANKGDHFAMFDLTNETNAFLFEADVTFPTAATNTKMSAGLAFGVEDKANPKAANKAWYAANIDTSRALSTNENTKNSAIRVFKVVGSSLKSEPTKSGIDTNIIDITKPLHFKIEMEADGTYTYSIGNVGGETQTFTSQILDWKGGYVGLLTYQEDAVFSNIHFVNRNYEGPISVTNTNGYYKTDLENLSYTTGNWNVKENGLESVSTTGESYLLSTSTGSNFVYSTDLKFNATSGDAGIIFRSNNNLNNKEGYVVTVSDTGASSASVNFWRWYRNGEVKLLNTKKVTSADNYNLKAVAYETWMLCYINGELVSSLGDYYVQNKTGQATVPENGYFGLFNENANVTFQNTYYYEFDNNLNPVIDNIYVTSDTGTVEALTQFSDDEPIIVQYVKNNATTVNVNVITENENSIVVVKDADGNTYENGKNVPVNVGANVLTVTSTSTYTDANGVQYDATVTHHVNVRRLEKDEIYYNEAYRDQYHYSVRDGWANDPNGMVYYNGKYHLFYQFYDEPTHGPMLWAHASSSDLITWEEHPVAFYTDGNGEEYSGCMVVDEDNTSGLFKNDDGSKAEKGGLVAIITENGNGQRVKIAYSEDDGVTWTKVDKIVADWSDDPVNSTAFRDPKVFRWENKWFMVIAGGKLRIYSSDNLMDWKCENYYNGTSGAFNKLNIGTECPDLYPIETQDAEGKTVIKWVLSECGRYYRVGDFKEVDGKWAFVPDSAYTSSRGVMNFAPDNYAAMTYYVQNFGTAQNPTLPEIIQINWMNNWNYADSIDGIVGQNFNGTFTLNLSLGLKYDATAGKYVLTQTPITNTENDTAATLKHKGYEDLRDTTPLVDTNGYVSVDENNTLLSEINEDTYEIVANFKPATGTTKVGFKVRVGNEQETLVYYDLSTNKIVIDRVNSTAFTFSNAYHTVRSQSVTRNEDGSIDLHIYVDKASVEVFTKDYTVSGAVQIFPDPLSLGASVYVEGSAAEVDLTIYSLKSIWKNATNKPVSVESNDSDTISIKVNKESTISAYVLPVEAKQGIVWKVVEGDEFVTIEEKDGKLVIGGVKVGIAKIKAISSENENVSKEFTVNVHDFKTNIEDWTNVYGNWSITGEILSETCGSSNNYYMSTNPVNSTDFVLETDLAFKNGYANIFFSSDAKDPSNLAYTVQFYKGRNFARLMYFKGSKIKDGTLPKSLALDTGEYFHVTIEKSGMTVNVYVNDELCLTHEFTSVSDFYNNPAHVGLGVYGGTINAQNFYVYDTTMVTEHYEIFEALKAEDYTVASYDAYKKAVDKAKEGITAINIAELVNELNTAKAGLVSVVDLNTILTTAKDVLADNAYTMTSTNILKEAMLSAETLKEAGTREEIEEAIHAIEIAMKSLVVKGDPTALNTVLESIENLEAEDYTKASMELLNEAVENTQEVLINEDATQEMMDAATKALEEAYDALVNVESLKDIINDVKDTNLDTYTKDSVNVFKDALEYANAVIVDGTREEVEAAKEALLKAYDGLTVKETPETKDVTNVAGLLAILLASAYVLTRKRKA